MSAVQPCLDSKEMTTSTTDFLESFKTIDEERDSDEESFHLFLDDDDEEHINIDEKLQQTKTDDDANKNNDEEKEKVNEPIVAKTEETTQNCNSEQISTDEVNEVEKSEESQQAHNDGDNETTNTSENKLLTSNEDQENITKDSENPQTPDESMELEKSSTEEDSSEPQRNICEKEENSSLTIDNTASPPVVAADLEQMNVEISAASEKNETNSTNTLILTEDVVKNDTKSNCIAASIDSAENEDDILNKHAIEVPDSSDVAEELDPTLEDTLLNENDEDSEKEDPEIISTKSELLSSPVVENIPTLTSAVSNEAEAVTKSSESVSSSNGAQENLDSALKEESAVLEETEIGKCEKMVIANPESDPVSQKCDDNSNSSIPSDSEDLLDISMIKDSAQDDADIAEDALQLEQENEDSDCNSRGKLVDRLESIDESSNLENSDEDGKEGYSSENQETSEETHNENEFLDCEKEKDIANDDDKENNVDKLIDNVEPEDQSEIVPEENEENVNTNTIQSVEHAQSPTREKEGNTIGGKPATKRTLSDSALESDPKKLKLVDEIKTKENEDEKWDITELESLISFSKFMTKSRLKKLTRTDLEEFCVQKLCEAILHKSELGETNHQLKIQEQTIEVLRKEQTVLTKQVKDLEIVNKKLMHEVKCNIGSKPIVPVKITRSVGLQVRMAQPNDSSAAKRRSNLVSPQKSPSPQSPVVNNRIARVTPSTAINRTVVAKTPQKTTNTPILTQVLQSNKRTILKTANTPPQNNTAIRSSPITKPSPEKRVRTSGSFIDLTDEDDKRANKKNQNTVKTIVQQGVRINTVPKSMPSVLPSAPQVMYVVQSNSNLKQGLLTTSAGQQKTVLVNFQPANGVLGSLNSSSLSVIPKAATTGAQLKTTSSLLKNKHPAPLPNPPLIQGPNDKTLKGIPPKPVLSIRKTNTGIILQWRMPYDLGLYEGIASYQLYAYQETAAPPSTDMWRKVGDVKAMALPMACTLTQFADKNKYYFAVRPVDIHKRIGRFSNPEEIAL